LIEPRAASSSAAVVVTPLLAVAVCAALLSLVAFAFFPFDETTPPSLMSVLAQDFAQMKSSPAADTSDRVERVMAYTKPPILSGGRKQYITSTIKNGAIIFSLPNGTMAANFLLRCIKKYDCRVSNATDNTHIKITVTQRTPSV
jgi:hypothetical protein